MGFFFFFFFFFSKKSPGSLVYHSAGKSIYIQSTKGLLNRYVFTIKDDVQSLSHVLLFAILWTTACQGALSFTISGSLFKLMSIESVMPSNHLILCRPLLLLPSSFPSIRVFSSGSGLHIRWPKYWSQILI